MAKKNKENFDIASLNKERYIEGNYIKGDVSSSPKETKQKQITVVFFLCFLLVSISLLVYSIYSGSQSELAPSSIAASYTPAPLATDYTFEASRILNASTPVPRQALSKYDEYVDIYPELVGWISIDNIKVDCPVVQNTDPNLMHKYIDLGPDLNPNIKGSIFLDIRNSNDASDRHTIIYGHNMKDGSMFGQLDKYLERSFYFDHLIIRYDTLYQELEWEVFNVFITDTSFDYIKTYFPTDEDFVNLMTQCIYKSYYNDNKAVISPDDKVLTLSTCTNKIDDGRLVVQARLITPLDTEETTEASVP